MDYFCKDQVDGTTIYIKWNKPEVEYSEATNYFNFIGVTQQEVDQAVADGTGVLFETRQELKQKMQYWFDRRAAYPSIGHQLDTLYNKGQDAWKAEVQAVKDKFPKPEGV